MSFAEIRLPGKFDFGTSLLPSFEVDTVVTGSGREFRNLYHDTDLRSGDIGSRALRTADYEKLYQFYLARRGTWEGFRYRNPTDYVVEDSPLAPDGSPTVQLRKRYADGNNNVLDRDIKKPVSGDVALERNGNPYSFASVDTTTGIVTLSKDKDLTISDVTAASPAEVTTSSDHGLSGGEDIWITGTGLSEIDDQVWTITKVDADTVSLDGSDTSGTGGSSSGSLEKYVQPNESLTWSGTYDTPVRFDGEFPNQYQASDQSERDQVVLVDRIPIKELRL